MEVKKIPALTCEKCGSTRMVSTSPKYYNCMDCGTRRLKNGKLVQVAKEIDAKETRLTGEGARCVINIGYHGRDL